MVFDGFRRSFDELLSRATRPEERRIVASRMRDTLVQAKMGLSELRAGLEKTRHRLIAETDDLETVRRRKQLAERIGDQETVDVASKYEEMHARRVDVVRQKVAAQEAEFALAEHDVEAMSAELKSVLSGSNPREAAEAPALDSDTEADPESGAAAIRDDIHALNRVRARADREADAARRLDELKRRMGK